MSKRSFRLALAIVAGSLLVLGVIALFVVKAAREYPYEAKSGTGKEVPVTIDPGMSFPKIAQRLHEHEIIDNPRWFRLYAMHQGKTTNVRAGDYVLQDNMSPKDVLDELIKGVEEVTVSVTIPEGLHMLEVFDILVDSKVVESKDELVSMARDPEFLASLGIEGNSIEGYLFPETYRFSVPSSAKEVLSHMVKQHRIVWDRVQRTYPKELARLRKRLDWTDREILIMASIVEKEAVVDEERPRIAQVFINRLTSPSFSPKKLETDPTIRYGCMVPVEKSEGCQKWDRSQRLRRAQLDDKDNPYNTYQHEGLPPGPICSPGEAALAATVNPDGSNYFYFVAKDDRSHVFSRTYAEHERAVDKYQR